MALHHFWKVLPRLSGQGISPRSVSMSGPHSFHSSTFSMMMTSGFARSAQSTITHARSRMFRSTGLPPLALEKCLQSGENQARPTCFPAT
ncbi:hypothetical protein D9M72_470280 [compost metagenome]